MSQIVSATAWHETGSDRRIEHRIQAMGAADITIFDGMTFTKLKGTIVDVSKSGFQVVLNTPLESGRPVGLRLRTALVIGKVENCRQNEQGGFRVGILTTSVTDSLLERSSRTSDYEACLRGFSSDDPDPKAQM
jgi:hypothetical protein